MAYTSCMWIPLSNIIDSTVFFCRNKTMECIIRLILVSVLFPVAVKGHGRLLDPPGRSSLWRYDNRAQANYEDHELNCGGYRVGQTADTRILHIHVGFFFYLR